MDLAPLQALTDARDRPTVFFLFGEEPIDRGPVSALHDELSGRDLDEVDLIIHSAGGSAHAAYQAMTLLRAHANTIHGCVPFWAKGAAMLLCVGSDTITLGEQAELGPLDVQIYEERADGEGGFRSALDPLKELEHLQTLSIEALASAMRFIATHYEMGQDDSLRHAMSFVEVTTGLLTAQLDPDTIGQCGRELAVATEYGVRLLSRSSTWPPKKINAAIDQLVYGYPSHEYVIDDQELTSLGFEVGEFAHGERAAVAALLPFVEEVEGSFVKLLEPSASAPVAPPERATQEITVSAIADGGAGAHGGGSAPVLAHGSPGQG